MTLEEVALGFVKVANEAMCRPIRNLTEVNYFYIEDIFVALNTGKPRI